MKIIYTDSANTELDSFQSQRKDELESFIKNKKYVFGDDVIEVTASDIREAGKYFKVVEFSRSKLPLTSILLKLYLFAGITMVLVGLFYPQLMEIIDQNPKQLTLVLGGIAMSLVSVFGNYYFRIREDRRVEFERRYKEYEDRNNSDL